VATVSDALHYRFPPARAYRLNRCLFRLKSDGEFLAAYVADPDAALREAELDPDDRAAMLEGDRDRLVGRGAHPYLVFMADLRVRMQRGGGPFEYF
jgi:hypothetical protein